MDYTFAEPHEMGGTSIVTISDKQIIEVMKLLHKELTDEQLIKEFCTVHWATKVKSKRKLNKETKS